MNAFKKSHMTLLVAALCFVASACNLGSPIDRSYQGPSKVAFEFQDQTVQGKDEDLSINVQLIGPQRDKDLTVAYEVVDSLTTAQEGVQYTLPANKEVTIAANTSQKGFTMHVASSKVPKEKPVKITLRLKGTNKVKADKNLGQYQLILKN